MIVKFNDKLGLPQFRLEQKDLNDARAIEDMMKTKGWKILMDYWELGRESVIEAGKDGIRLKSKKDLSPEKWALLKGFDECCAIPQRIVGRAKEELKREEEERKEALKGETGNDYGE